jgi:hypothetical protein
MSARGSHGLGCVLALAFAFSVAAGCGRAKKPTEALPDAAAFDRPSDHLGKDELVPKREDCLGLPLPAGFVKVHVQPGEEVAQGEATLEAMRRHVLEHSMNGVAKPEPGALVWWDAEIPGRGAARFAIRASDDGQGRVTLTVRAQEPRAAIDGGSGEVLRALGLDDRGYPTDEGDRR